MGFFLSSFFLGRSLNYRKQRVYYRLLRDALMPFVQKFSFKGMGSSGFTIALPYKVVKKMPFRKLEMTVLLLDRENVLHYLISRLRRDKDKTIIKMDLRSRPNIVMEGALRGSPSFYMALGVPHEKRLRVLKEGSLSSKYLVKATDTGTARRILEVFMKAEHFRSVYPYIEYFSISSRSPHLILVYNNNGKYAHIFEFLKSVAEGLNDLFGRAEKKKR
ncbi:MAG: hypothetical protein ACTSXJ_09710 [Candidatus Baldrarchaeia archaeon]